MAVDINLFVYDAGRRERLAALQLYFGPALWLNRRGQNQWLDAEGIVVDNPAAYQYEDSRHVKEIGKERLRQWIAAGYLSRRQGMQDNASFLNVYPPDAVFALWLVDWS